MIINSASETKIIKIFSKLIRRLDTVTPSTQGLLPYRRTHLAKFDYSKFSFFSKDSEGHSAWKCPSAPHCQHSFWTRPNLVLKLAFPLNFTLLISFSFFLTNLVPSLFPYLKLKLFFTIYLLWRKSTFLNYFDAIIILFIAFKEISPSNSFIKLSDNATMLLCTCNFIPHLE